jgi:acetylornithine deacetylase/succinyl-diaminopimelate desuccinylase-like protein
LDGTRPIVNVATMIAGGEVAFAHPPELRATIEVRVITGMTERLVVDRLEAVLHEAGLGELARIRPLADRSWIDPGNTVTDPALLNAVETAMQSVLGRVPEPAVLPAGTDSSHLDALGIPALPAVGPGSLAVAHRPDEFIRAEDLHIAVPLFETFARRYAEDSG